MKKWILSILSADGDQSSKRLIGIYCILSGSAMAWIATFTDHKTPDYMYNTMMYIGAAAFLGTVAETVFTMRTRAKKQKPEVKDEQPQEPENTDN